MSILRSVEQRLNTLNPEPSPWCCTWYFRDLDDVNRAVFCYRVRGPGHPWEFWPAGEPVPEDCIITEAADDTSWLYRDDESDMEVRKQRFAENMELISQPPFNLGHAEGSNEPDYC